MQTTRFTKFLLVLILAITGLCLMFGSVFAAQPGSPQCKSNNPPNPQVFNRCYTTGYFSGSPNYAYSGSYAPVGFPLTTPYTYSDTTSFPHWAFPQLTGSSTKNSAYATTFVNEIGNYLNGNFSSSGPSHCDDGQPYIPGSGGAYGGSYDPTKHENDLNYFRSVIGYGDLTSLGTTCYNLRSDATGAAMIVDTMMNKNGSDFGNCGSHQYSCIGNGITFAKSVFPVWESLVLSYDANGWVNWDTEITAGVGHLNTTSMNWGADDEFFTWTSAAYNTNAIVFVNPSNGQKYTINRQCSNLIGDTSGFSDFDLHPLVNASASPVPAGEDVSFNFSVDNVGEGASIDTPYKTTYSVTPGPGSGLPSGPKGTSSFGLGTTSLGSKTLSTKTYPAGTKICATLTVGPPAAYNFAGSRSAKACTYVVWAPYFTTTGDVSAGEGMSAGGTDCAVAPDKNGGIVSWNRDGGSSGTDFSGAGTHYAAFALSHLQDFVTAQGIGQPDSLAFANTKAGDVNYGGGNGLYGGYFGGNPYSGNGLSCVHDYFTNATNIKTGNITINGQPVTNNSSTVMYVQGNVYIKGNITFSGSYSNIGQIPAFDVIVEPNPKNPKTTGNIYISPNVTQLDGLYVAEPTVVGKNTYGGIVYTCTSGPFAPQALNRSLYNQCSGNSLTFNGAVVARQVWLLRASGSISTSPSEVFNFTPEAWLATPPDGVTGSGGAGEFDAITSLPPVL